ncbi:MAG: sugar ABC transporter permease, partial [Actinomycetota bacterium]|nr:sugar ABC transporter permease [Actinomycetota bacterium]
MSATSTSTATATADRPAPPRSRSRSGPRAGRSRIGPLFIAPYVLFLVAIFAYPVGLAVYMSFRDYFFAAPGAVVD